jgi:hypothetical protein
MTRRKQDGPGYADAVRAAREAAGKDLGEMAAALDMSFESYRDIEDYDDEITSVISFRDAITLAELIELDLRRLFGADDTVVTFAELAAAMRPATASSVHSCLLEFALQPVLDGRAPADDPRAPSDVCGNFNHQGRRARRRPRRLRRVPVRVRARVAAGDRHCARCEEAACPAPRTARASWP